MPPKWSVSPKYYSLQNHHFYTLGRRSARPMRERHWLNLRNCWRFQSHNIVVSTQIFPIFIRFTWASCLPLPVTWMSTQSRSIVSSISGLDFRFVNPVLSRACRLFMPALMPPRSVETRRWQVHLWVTWIRLRDHWSKRSGAWRVHSN